jgi:hypothetical protein
VVVIILDILDILDILNILARNRFGLGEVLVDAEK